MRLNSGTLIAAAVLLLTLLVAGVIAMRGDGKPVIADSDKTVPVNVSGTTPQRGRASEAAAVPQPEQPKPGDPVPPLPSNWR
jgi:hypothetical protein